jgi:tetratricopeptide (TPR) repeat protein
MADLAFQQQDAKTSLTYADHALALNPALRNVRLTRASDYMLLGDFAAGERDLQLLTQQGKADAAALERLGVLAVLKKQYPEAEKKLEESLTANNAYTPALKDLVQLYFVQKKPEKAITRVQQQIQRAPEQAELYELLGNLQLQQRDYAGAERTYRQALQKNPDFYFSYSQLALIEANAGKLQEALLDAQHSIDKNPKFLLGYISLGNLHERLNQFEEAKAIYKKALGINPNYAPALNNLAWLYCEHGGNLDEALSLAQQAKAAAPASPNISDTLGWVEYRKGLYASAAQDLKEAAKASPDSSGIQYHLGMALFKDGRLAEAKPVLQRALDLKIPTEQAEEIKQQLKDMSSRSM